MVVEVGVGVGCWSWLLELVVGAGCWSWLLELVVGAGCWSWLLELVVVETFGGCANGGFNLNGKS